MTFSFSTIFNGTILDTVANPHYQFRIDLSPADHCHCLTVDSATGVIGNIIFNQWRDGSFWCGSNITQLCASSSNNNTFYSALISQNGSLLRDGALLCDNSAALDISINPQVSKMINNCNKISGMNLANSFLCFQVVAMYTLIIYLDAKFTAVGDVWKEAPRCSISRKNDVQSCPSLSNANG